MKTLWLTAAVTLSLFSKTEIPQNMLKPGDSLPSFQTTDVNGKKMTDSLFKGKRTLISFQRNVGCPICNLHVHQLLDQAEVLKKDGIEVVLVYQSSRENMKSYLDGQRFPFTFIPDPDNTLYTLFGIEKSFGKLMKGTFHGSVARMREGKKLFTKKIPMDGDMSVIGADFLVNAEGRVIKAHYGQYVGDHLTADQVKEEFKKLK